MKIFKWVGLGVAAVGLVDLMWGSTNTPILPAPIADVLNQQIDAVLIIGGLVVFFYAK